VPRIGNDWGNCDPANPRNRRRRCAMLIEAARQIEDIESSDEVTRVLVDCGPDMREQLLSANVSHLDAAILTHAHADHIFGLDDLRQLWVRHGEPVDVYSDRPTRDIVFGAFGYCFVRAPGSSYPPFCIDRDLPANQPLQIEGRGGPLKLTPIQVEHGDIDSFGIRVGNAVYMPDVKTVNRPDSLALLANTELLIVDALRRKSHPTHMSVDEALDFVQQIAPHKTILTNMHGDLDYESLLSELPSGVTPAYDGLSMIIDAD